MDHVAEFDCTDCGVHVVSVAPPHNPAHRCAGCQWLHDVPESVTQAYADELRQTLKRLGVIGSGDPACPGEEV
jgi:hypothetical protein